MRAMKLMYQRDQQGAQPSSRLRVPVIWPWVLVIVAWTVALLATLTKQTFLINHNYLLTQSHLSWLVALVVFLACWQLRPLRHKCTEVPVPHPPFPASPEGETGSWWR
jgi:hypothetical protein